MGRLTSNPEIRYTTGENPTSVARYTLAVDRWYKRQGDDQTADFINCVVFGRGAEFAENYLHQGTKIVAVGRIQTGSYTNKDNQKINTTDVVVESVEFAESKIILDEKGKQQVEKDKVVISVLPVIPDSGKDSDKNWEEEQIMKKEETEE